MKEILEIIIKNLVEDEKSVSVVEQEKNGTVTLQVRVAESDMGKVIGKQGRIAQSIRTVIKSVATKEHKKVVVEFIDK